MIDSRIEVLNGDGVWLADIHPDSAEISFQGSGSERWQATLHMVDLFAVSVDDLLHPFAQNLIRIWWREFVDGAWAETLVMTGYPEDPSGDKTPELAWTLVLLDAVAEAKRGGYDGQTLEVGGLTVDAALDALFDLIAPNIPHAFPATDVVLAPTYTLGASEDVEADWTKIAMVSGWTVYSDRTGLITAGPTPSPAEPKADWQEGDDCRIVSLTFSLKTSTVKNSWKAKSSSPDIVPPITGSAKDTDPGSPTWVGVYGPYPGTITLDTIGDQAGADNAAAKQLELSRRPSQEVTITCPPRPDFDYYDVINCGSPDVGVVGPYNVAGWRLQMPSAGTNPGLMTVWMLSRSAA